MGSSTKESAISIEIKMRDGERKDEEIRIGYKKRKWGGEKNKIN